MNQVVITNGNYCSTVVIVEIKKEIFPALLDGKIFAIIIKMQHYKIN